MYLRNTTKKDLELSLDSVAYLFPATPDAKPVVEAPKAKISEDGKASPPPLPAKPVPVKVVQVGDDLIAQHFIDRTLQHGGRRHDGEPSHHSYQLVAYVPAKTAKVGVDYEVVARYFEKAPPVPEAGSAHSIHSDTRRKPGDPQPERPKEMRDDLRRSHINSFSFDVLKRQAVKMGLMKERDRAEKKDLTDKLFAAAWDPENPQ
jgi:hypothetical protein